MTISEQFDFSGLNPADRLTLIGELWDSVENESLPIPQWHIDELNRISALEDAGKLSYSTWDDVKKRIASKHEL